MAKRMLYEKRDLQIKNQMLEDSLVKLQDKYNKLKDKYMELKEKFLEARKNVCN
jgi:predicted nuclease with TOPRIM domain